MKQSWYTLGNPGFWSGPITVGSATNALDVRAVWNPAGNTDVFFANTSGDVGEVWYTPGNPGFWSGPITIG